MTEYAGPSCPPFPPRYVCTTVFARPTHLYFLQSQCSQPPPNHDAVSRTAATPRSISGDEEGPALSFVSTYADARRHEKRQRQSIPGAMTRPNHSAGGNAGCTVGHPSEGDELRLRPCVDFCTCRVRGDGGYVYCKSVRTLRRVYLIMYCIYNQYNFF